MKDEKLSMCSISQAIFYWHKLNISMFFLLLSCKTSIALRNISSTARSLSNQIESLRFSIAEVSFACSTASTACLFAIVTVLIRIAASKWCVLCCCAMIKTLSDHNCWSIRELKLTWKDLHVALCAFRTCHILASVSQFTLKLLLGSAEEKVDLFLATNCCCYFARVDWTSSLLFIDVSRAITFILL